MNDATFALGCALLEDRSLIVRSDAATEARLADWLPHLPTDDFEPSATGATIDLVCRAAGAGGSPSEASDGVPRGADRRDPAASPRRPATPPDLVLDPIHAWIDDDAPCVTFHARDDAVAGSIDLERLRAVIAVVPAVACGEGPARGERHAGTFSALTLAAALLLNRMHRALLHAAAVATPDGAAWLLVGDAFSGKTTTTVNLLARSWNYLSDDHVVLARDADGRLTVEGWPRAFHLDRGYAAGESTGEREAADPRALAPGRWRRRAPLAGVLFPSVVADRPTDATPIPAADALGRLIRQSPWLLADRAVARDVLALLADAVAGARLALRLGRDSYRDPDRLLAVLRTTQGRA